MTGPDSGYADDLADDPMSMDGWDALPAHVKAQFLDMGWAPTQWVVLHHRLDPDESEEARLGAWLENPPAHFTQPVTAQTVGETFNRYGLHADTVLTAYAAGASARFVAETVFCSDYACIKAGLPPGGVRNDNPAHAWTTLHQVPGMTEEAATGWAYTGELFNTPYMTTNRQHPHPGKYPILERLTPWTDLFGPSAYLFILAGFTLEEAAALKEAGTQMSEQQLRVMAALAGNDQISPGSEPQVGFRPNR